MFRFNIRCTFLCLLLAICMGFVSCSRKYVSKQGDVESKSDDKIESNVDNDNRDDVNDNDDKVDDNDDDKDDFAEISDVYKAMAIDLNIKVDDNYEAIVLPVGVSFDEDSLKSMLSNLNFWSEKYDEDDIEKLFILVKNEETGKIYLSAQEFYLVIPKYENAKVSLQELNLSENGNLVPVKNEFIDGKSFNGPVLIAQNISDIYPNAEIKIKRKDKEVKFSPFVSLKDGEIMLDDSVYNAIDLLPKNIDNQKYDRELFDEIIKYFFN